MERSLEKSIPYSKERLRDLLNLTGYTSLPQSEEGLSFFRRIHPPEKSPRYHIKIGNWNGTAEVNFHVDIRTHRSLVFSDVRLEELKRIFSTLSLLPQSPERQFLIINLNKELLFGTSRKVAHFEQRVGRRIDYKGMRNRQKGKKPERLKDSGYLETLD